MEPMVSPPSPVLSAPSRNIDVRRYFFDSFTIGVVIGAIAAAIGFVIGMAYFLLSN